MTSACVKLLKRVLSMLNLSRLYADSVCGTGGLNRKGTMFERYRQRVSAYFNMGQPVGATMEEWDEINARCRHDYPVRWFITHTVPTAFHRVFVRLLGDAKWWFRHRVTDRYNVIHINDLKPGYYDADTRLLHGSFALLVDLVEIEKACMQRASEDGRRRRFGWRHPRRDAQAGLAHLAWEATLDDPALREHENSPAQAEGAREIVALYQWWTHARPLRHEPHDVSGWSEYRAAKRLRSRRGDAGPILERLREIEERYEAEDTEMLIRLVKVRRHLWT